MSKDQLQNSSVEQICVCALYKFVDLPNFEDIQKPLLSKMTELYIKGTLLLASEGINGTVAGTQKSVRVLLDWFEQQKGLESIVTKFSYENEIPFYRTKVKLKKEIVTMGVDGVDPKKVVGTYVKPSEWNALISDPDVTVIDTRNQYEIEIGTFKHAVNPKTETFREFPQYAKDNLDPKQNKKVAMFCTGGIRCEKSTAYMKEQGFDEVYHLEGGILKYLEEVKQEESLWEGECFVFDNRVAVNHNLEKGQYQQCNACRLPITDADMESADYVKGVSCPKCIDKISDAQKQRFSERERQVQLAKERNEAHIGSDVKGVIENRRKKKASLKAQQQKK
ncbi:rhodanese-related sulfurtransferase [Parashewanella spongiae]|uniref:tRNA uridine(34) hydroxylase n=1 Tax=Parashewanella spongiae TaxID=342950 RepID=A0A3A6UH54_9GAMM|nr:rhodanese-related sulfurtransferase [Parashewanella spongiae]MCL1077354.1 rhodanese-related sulfurtransferase [Parashewanella spongiae]RJY18322.1 rhodanese-related sulfurtransferase [Parashewanella spongiae]